MPPAQAGDFWCYPLFSDHNIWIIVATFNKISQFVHLTDRVIMTIIKASIANHVCNKWWEYDFCLDGTICKMRNCTGDPALDRKDRIYCFRGYELRSGQLAISDDCFHNIDKLRAQLNARKQLATLMSLDTESEDNAIILPTPKRKVVTNTTAAPAITAAMTTKATSPMPLTTKAAMPPEMVLIPPPIPMLAYLSTKNTSSILDALPPTEDKTAPPKAFIRLSKGTAYSYMLEQPKTEGQTELIQWNETLCRQLATSMEANSQLYAAVAEYSIKLNETYQHLDMMTEHMKDLRASLVIATSSVTAIQPHLDGFDTFFNKVEMTIKEVDDMFKQAGIESAWTEQKKKGIRKLRRGMIEKWQCK